jgi:RHS repeat-associated protein
MLANMFAVRRFVRALVLTLVALFAIALLLAPSRAVAATPPPWAAGSDTLPAHQDASARETPKRRNAPVFPCRAQRAPNRIATTVQHRTVQGACEHGFGEDRRRAGPITRCAAPHHKRQCRGRAPASWGNDTTGNVRHLHAGQRFSEENPDGNDPEYTGDLGGYAYSAFGKRLPASDVGGLAPPGFSQPFTWQGKRQLSENLYYSRARIWSADLGVFLQPDQYAYLSRGGTLWSWPGQNPFRWADPSGRIGFDGPSTDRAIGSPQDWGDPSFGRGQQYGFAAAVLAGVAGFAGSIEGAVAAIIGRALASSSVGIRTAGVIGSAAIGGAKECSSDTPSSGIGSVARWGAKGAANAGKLGKQLASEEGVAELLSGGGKVIAGPGTKTPLRDVGRLVSEYGGSAEQWVKVTSTAERHLQTHGYRNLVTGQLVELKSILP